MPQSSRCTFTNERGLELSARLVRPDGAVRATALFAHCFTCSKDLKVERRLVDALVSEGYAVLSFDFTGMGQSEGDLGAATFATDLQDLVAAAEHLRSSLAGPSLLVGHSLGGAAVIAAAASIPEADAIVTIGAPAHPAHVKNLFAGDLGEIRSRGDAEVTIGGRSFTVTSAFLDALDAADPATALREFRGALLLFHSPDDEVVGIDNARELYDAARHPKSFVSLDGADHLLTDERDARYVAEVTSAWAGRHVQGPMDLVTEEYAAKAAMAVNTGGLRTELATRGFEFAADEPSSVGGTESGPTPYEYLTMGLAACTSMTVRMYADRKGLPLDEVRTTVTHDRVHADDCEHCDHEEGQVNLFDRTVELRGDLQDSDRERLLSIANRCPVHRTLTGQIEVHTSLSDG